MIKTIINLFTYRKPEFTRFHAEDVVMDGKAYFLFSWELENAYRLKIPALRYSTWKHSGSAYLIIPDGVNEIDLLAVTLWRSSTKTCKISRAVVDNPIDFRPVSLRLKLHAGSVYQPQLNLKLKSPSLKRQLGDVKIPVFNLNQS